MIEQAIPLIEASRVRLQGAPVGHTFDFHLKASERWLIRGPLDDVRPFFIKTLAGLIPAAAGQVRINGLDVEQDSSAMLLRQRRRLGVVLERDGLLPAWTGAENLGLPLRYHQMATEDEIASRINDLRTRYAIPSSWIDRPVAELSAPRRSALALMRTQLLSPAAILAEDLPLQAIADCGSPQLQQLLIDIFDGSYAMILTQPVAEHSRLPACMEHIEFQQARLQGGQLDMINNGA